MYHIMGRLCQFTDSSLKNVSIEPITWLSNVHWPVVVGEKYGWRCTSEARISVVPHRDHVISLIAPRNFLNRDDKRAVGDRGG